MNDSLISLLLIIILGCHFAGLIIGYVTRKTTLILAYVNAVFVMGVFAFWTITSWSKKQYNIETNELLVICLEACIFIGAMYSIRGFYTKTYVKIINIMGYGIHVLATIGLLYYITLFKFDRLF